MSSPAGSGGGERVGTEGSALLCLASLNASSDPATEDPNRDLDRPVEVGVRLKNMCGGRDGLSCDRGAVAVEGLDRRGLSSAEVKGRRPP